MKTKTQISRIAIFCTMLLPSFSALAQEAALDSLLMHAEKKYQARSFDEAETMLDQALQTAEIQWGEVSAQYGKVCHKYGSLYHAKGAYAKAEEWALRAKSVYEQAGLQHSAAYAGVLHQLGIVNYHWGNNYEKAELYYLEAKKVLENTVGKDNPDYAATMNSLGNLYFFTGNYDLAETYYFESMQIREKVLGTDNILYSGSLYNLANVNRVLSNYEKAEELSRKNITIIEKTMGTRNLYYAGGLFGLANIYIDMGLYDKAEPLLIESKRILEDLPNYTKIPNYMSCMEYLGNLYYCKSEYNQSELYHLKAKDIRGKMLGREHLSYQFSLAHLSVLYWKMGQLKKSAQHFTEASDLRKSLLSEASRHFSEKEVYSFVIKFNNELDKHLSFANNFSQKVPSFSGVCFDNALFYKGFLLNTSYHIRNLNISNPALFKKLNQVNSWKKQLAVEYAKSASEINVNLVSNLETQINTFEKEIASQAVGTGYGEAIRQVSWQEVHSALAPDEAALEFVHFNSYTPEPSDNVMYAALLLKPGMEHPLFIPLFNEQMLEELLPPLEKNRYEYVNKLYHNKAAARLVWSPIVAQLRDVKTLYCAPSGLLHRLNLAALPMPGAGEGIIMADRYDIVLLGSTRQLANRNSSVTRDDPDAGSVFTDAVVIGAVQYDMDSTAIPPSSSDTLYGSSRGISFADTEPIFRGGELKYLKHSEQETANITAILKKAGMLVETLHGFSATEEAFKRICEFDEKPSPGIMHFSTHGYFFPDPASGGNGQSSVANSGQPVFKVAEHPMIRSGLLLAGAKYAWVHGKPLGKREDGVLTAYEISQLDLRNTELVVLSACETGLGDIRSNEGVYGLQRAFKIAGVKNLIMSLWQVPDYHTQELMTAFYQKWLTEKLPMRRALQAAQEEMRDKGYEPYSWAGWVLVE
jgi:CHAT domain-containing protein/tetratricopeptide (TPR) repeat protein